MAFSFFTRMNRSPLTRYAWLSLGVAIVTIALKFIAFRITGSVGLLSDALEGLVNLVGASLATAMLLIAARPPDENHSFGHDKAEYFSSVVEGTLIVLAAIGISAAAIGRIITPRPVEQAALGLGISVAASLVNLWVARLLLRVGRKSRSITLEANGQHLMTDVWTSAGVFIGVTAVALTGWQPLDPLVALVVAANVVRTGVRLVQRSVFGLMDTALPAEEQAQVRQVLERYAASGAQYHALRTRQSGPRRFLAMHVLVPGAWSVRRGHELLEALEADLRQVLPNTNISTHLEPLDEASSYQDTDLDRANISTADPPLIQKRPNTIK